MRLYSVFLRNHGRDVERDLVLVKDGFSWPAFLFTAFWALWHRMWWIAAALFAAVMLSGWVTRFAGGNAVSESVAGLAAAAAIGFLANGFRRWHLERGGFQEVAVVTGKNQERAMRRFLDDADADAAGIFP